MHRVDWNPCSFFSTIHWSFRLELLLHALIPSPVNVFCTRLLPQFPPWFTEHGTFIRGGIHLLSLQPKPLSVFEDLALLNRMQEIHLEVCHTALGTSRLPALQVKTLSHNTWVMKPWRLELLNGRCKHRARILHSVYEKLKSPWVNGTWTWLKMTSYLPDSWSAGLMPHS